VSGVLWLLNYQSSEGYFVESTKVPFHKAMAIGNMNITLTAHVLITLEETSPVLQVNFYNCTVFTVLQVKTLSSKL
jgi:hypothetical protein